MGKTFVDRPKQKVVMLGNRNGLNSSITVLESWFVDQVENLTTEELTSVIDRLTETRTRKIFGV